MKILPDNFQWKHKLKIKLQKRIDIPFPVHHVILFALHFFHELELFRPREGVVTRWGGKRFERIVTSLTKISLSAKPRWRSSLSMNFFYDDVWRKLRQTKRTRVKRETDWGFEEADYAWKLTRWSLPCADPPSPLRSFWTVFTVHQIGNYGPLKGPPPSAIRTRS